MQVQQICVCSHVKTKQMHNTDLSFCNLQLENKKNARHRQILIENYLNSFYMTFLVKVCCLTICSVQIQPHVTWNVKSCFTTKGICCPKSSTFVIVILHCHSKYFADISCKPLPVSLTIIINIYSLQRTLSAFQKSSENMMQENLYKQPKSSLFSLIIHMKTYLFILHKHVLK